MKLYIGQYNLANQTFSYAEEECDDENFTTSEYFENDIYTVKSTVKQEFYNVMENYVYTIVDLALDILVDYKYFKKETDKDESNASI